MNVCGVQLLLAISGVVLSLGLLTCVVSSRMGARSWRNHPPPHHDTTPGGTNKLTVLYSPMCESAAAAADRQTRLHSVQQDLMLDLPATVRLPDGEEGGGGPWTTVDDSETRRPFIRPPPNRTVPNRCRSSDFLPSTGMVATTKDSNIRTSPSPLVTRSHSVSAGSSNNATPPPRYSDIVGRIDV